MSKTTSKPTPEELAKSFTNEAAREQAIKEMAAAIVGGKRFGRRRGFGIR